jgi:hypothetical protein
LLAWLAICAHLIALGALLGIFESLGLKLGMVGIDVAGIFVIWAVFLGRLYEWNRLRGVLVAERDQRRADPDAGVRARRHSDTFRWPQTEEAA